MGDTTPSVNLTELVAAYHVELYRYAYRLCGCQADAEDLTQQTFLQAQRSQHQLRDPECARAWLYTILRNCYQLARRKQQRTTVEPLGELVDQLPDLSQEEIPIDTEQLQSALDTLPDEFKIPVLMYYFEAASYKEIAAQLDLPIGTVMSRLSRAKTHLRSLLFPVEQKADTH